MKLQHHHHAAFLTLVWLTVGGSGSYAFLKKPSKDKNTSPYPDNNDDNNGWAQFGFGQRPPLLPPPPYGAYRPPAYAGPGGPPVGFGPHPYPHSPQGFSPFAPYKVRGNGGGKFGGGPPILLGSKYHVPLLGKYYNHYPGSAAPSPLPPPPFPVRPRRPDQLPPPVPAKGGNKFAPLGSPPYGAGPYIYPAAYLPAYYMRLDPFAYRPPTATREPLLSKLSKLGKFRKPGYAVGGGSGGGGDPYAPLTPPPVYGPLGGQGRHLAVVLQQQQRFPTIPPAVGAYGVTSGFADHIPGNLKAPPTPIETHPPVCAHNNNYQGLGRKWLEDAPYKYTGHQFGVPLKDHPNSSSGNNNNAKNEP